LNTFNGILIEFGFHSIELKRNGMQTGGESTKNMFMNMHGIEIKKTPRFEKTPFYASLLGNWLNKF
jgi:hypothetical protein